MKRRISFVLVSLLSAGALFIIHFNERRTPPPAALPELFLLAPFDADSLLYIDLAALRGSPFLAQLISIAPPPSEDPDYREFVMATGFDYSRDLDHALIVICPSPSSASTLAFADGRFNREKISAYSLRSGKLKERNGIEVYEVSSGPPPRTISFAFLAPGRIVLSNSPAVNLTVPHPAQVLPPDLRERLLRVAGSALIVLLRVDASQENFSVFGFRSPDLKRALRDVRWLSLGARPSGDQLKVALEAECVSADAARNLTRAAETLRLLARLLLADARARRRLSPQAAALAEWILRNGEFTQMDQRVQLRFDLSANLFAIPASPEAERSSPARPR